MLSRSQIEIIDGGPREEFPEAIVAGQRTRRQETRITAAMVIIRTLIG